MRRTLLNILTGGSVLLGVVVAVLWMASYRNNSHGDDLVFSTRQGHFELLSQGGGLTLLKRDSFPWFFSGLLKAMATPAASTTRVTMVGMMTGNTTKGRVNRACLNRAN